jgi:hypothetical protein
MGVPPLIFKELLQSLIRKGLMFDDSFGRLDTSAYEVVEPTELGAAFFEWIRSPDPADAVQQAVAD